ncbi:ABC transporter ATP-binding protein [Ruminococcus flavefaciens]|uniref:Putative ABC transport system ATP-binding protein n=1 Tax=Ruminococcus flavefaciens TaxID=1265 RepID=A0A315XUY9_RUMFL|nr:ABC transporter ATP-binding protein [Ruminococcus flavefaciens]PWJ09988.1 putative ABC transport system ATP-binding protein [Ruminococcus flavefaciens]SSA52139.1 putative ABC transport system ATP-binding protein [Ruminococcus flavefaciens]
MLKLESVHKVYNKGKSNEFEALKGIDLKVNDGELVAIIGKSGAGKSTLLHILACIDSYESGKYCIDDTLVRNLSEKKLAEIRNKKIGMVMQDFALVDDFSCIENVLLPLDFSRKKISDKKTKAMNALKSVGMDSMAKKSVNKLSGGQKQRVAIARAIVNEPSVVLADEPTGALDSKTSAEIMELFHALNRKGKTVIIVTHDLEIAKQCNRIIEISDGKII